MQELRKLQFICVREGEGGCIFFQCNGGIEGLCWTILSYLANFAQTGRVSVCGLSVRLFSCDDSLSLPSVIRKIFSLRKNPKSISPYPCSLRLKSAVGRFKNDI